MQVTVRSMLRSRWDRFSIKENFDVRKKSVILLAILALVLASLACQLSAEADKTAERLRFPRPAMMAAEKSQPEENSN